MSSNQRAAEKQAPHISALDGLRGLAFLLVFVHHAGYSMITSLRPPIGPVVQAVTRSGWLGVDIFFALSGFLITSILLRTREASNFYRSFYARRALRIWPLYYLLVSVLFFTHLVPGSYAAAPAQDKILFLLNFNNIVTALDSSKYPFASLCWSLAVEEHFYLLWPFVVRWIKGRVLLAVCVLGILLELALRAIPFTKHMQAAHPDWIYRMSYTHYDGLLAGALFAVAIWEKVLLPRHTRMLAGFCVATFALAVWILHRSGGSWAAGLVSTPVFALAFSSLVALLALQEKKGALTRLFSFAPFRSIGKYSYCMYLTHPMVLAFTTPLLYRIFSGLGASGRYAAAITTCLAVTYGVGLLSWTLFEGPLNRLKRYTPYQFKPRAAQ